MRPDELVAIAARAEAAKHHNAVSKREGQQAVADRQALLDELLRYKDYRDAIQTRSGSFPFLSVVDR